MGLNGEVESPKELLIGVMMAAVRMKATARNLMATLKKERNLRHQSCKSKAADLNLQQKHRVQQKLIPPLPLSSIMPESIQRMCRGVQVEREPHLFVASVLHTSSSISVGESVSHKSESFPNIRLRCLSYTKSEEGGDAERKSYYELDHSIFCPREQLLS